MKRAVYSPKVWAYVNVNDKTRWPTPVVDLSNYIVSGSVDRQLNAVSTAELTLRNPNRIFTKRGNPAFRPMDSITIYMMRVPGYPRQVFTGYIDRSTAYQLYPGTIRITASCTLKRLQHIYFDPALPYMLNFLAAYGWVPTGNGMWVNPSERVNTLAAEGALTDAGFGNLLFGTLNQIGGWSPNSILIEKLPSTVQKKVTKVFTAFQDENEEAHETFQSVLSAILDSVPDGGGDGGGGGVDPDPDIRGNANVEKAFNYMRDRGFTAVQAAGAVGSLMGESGPGLDPTALNSIGAYGIAQWLGGRKSQLQSKRNYHLLSVQLKFIWEELGGSERNSYNLMKAATTIEDATIIWTQKFERPEKSGEHLPKRIGYAKAVYNKYANNTADDEPEEDDDSGARTTRMFRAAADSTNQNTSNDDAEDSEDAPKIFSPVRGLPAEGWPGPRGEYGATRGYPGGHAGVDAPSGREPWYAITDGVIDHVNANWAGSESAVVIKSSVRFEGYPYPLYMGYGSLQSVSVSAGDRVKAGDPIGVGGSHGSGPHLHFWLSSRSGSTNGNLDPTSFLKAAARGEQPSGGPGGGGGGSGGDDGSSTAFNPMAAAFAAEFSLPSLLETTEALLLQGQKSLMNDQPLFPFIEQLSQASLRSFQSLPDGRFFAFYPDYFGEYGKDGSGVDWPYWEIADVEILDGSIELTDENLVTHQFTVGDTIPDGQINIADRLLSSGMVSVFNIFDAGSEGENSLVPKFEGRKGREAALAFLAKFGARPNYEEAPFIRSPYFELLLAYQKFLMNWSAQYLTNFTFTFMPELYPGGKVGFREHGIKVYLESVTHTFDYEGGFTTSATISAPSAYGNADTLGEGLARVGMVTNA